MLNCLGVVSRVLSDCVRLALSTSDDGVSRRRQRNSGDQKRGWGRCAKQQRLAERPRDCARTLGTRTPFSLSARIRRLSRRLLMSSSPIGSRSCPVGNSPGESQLWPAWDFTQHGNRPLVQESYTAPAMAEMSVEKRSTTILRMYVVMGHAGGN
jgi:hypothetical protein